MEVNGKTYPLWGGIVEKKDTFIGGKLEELDLEGLPHRSTEIKDVTLTPYGEDSALFKVSGTDFDSNLVVTQGGIVAGEEGWITYTSFRGEKFRIQAKEKAAKKK